jgi:hypothetical protein
MIVPEQSFSWLREFVVPAFFTLLGSGIAFVFGHFYHDLKAKRAKDSFLVAVGMELDALDDQLDASLDQVKDAADRFRGGKPPQFAPTFRTTIFTSQVGKLRDVDDPLLIEVAHFYSDFGTLERIFEGANHLGREFSNTVTLSAQRDAIGASLESALMALQVSIKEHAARLRELRAKLQKPRQ